MSGAVGRARLEGKAALVTGSTRGIGEAIAKMFAAERAQVLVTGRSVNDGNRVAREITTGGGDAVFVHLDLADEESVAASVRACVGRFGSLDVLVNNGAPTGANLSVTGHPEGETDGNVVEVKTAVWRTIMTIGVDGVFWACKYAIPEMIRAGGGSIVNISSGVAIRGLRGSDAYTASKGAISALSRSIAAGFGANQIRSNSIIVGDIATPAGARRYALSPAWDKAIAEANLLGRHGTPDDIAYAATYLASDESSFVTASEITVDGGIHNRVPVPALPRDE